MENGRKGTLEVVVGGAVDGGIDAKRALEEGEVVGLLDLVELRLDRGDAVVQLQVLADLQG